MRSFAYVVNDNVFGECKYLVLEKLIILQFPIDIEVPKYLSSLNKEIQDTKVECW